MTKPSFLPPTVLVISLGGTITMTPTTAEGAAQPTLSAEELLAAVPQLADTGIVVKTQSFTTKPGASLTFDEIEELAGQLRAMDGQSAFDGFVVAQGTDTLEETSYLLSLLYAGQTPLIITGAMRAPYLAGADGPANLLASVTVAANPRARGLGVLVVFNDQIFDAAKVRKTHSTSTNAFTAPDTGPLGTVAEGRLRLLAIPAHKPLPLSTVMTRPARVGVYPASLGDDGTLLAPLLEQVDGMVIAAFGVGHVPATWVPILQEAAQRIPIVLASRTGGGTTLTHTYGFDGSEKDLLDRGLIGAGHLDPYKARHLLTVLLRSGAHRDTILATFAPAGTTAEGRG
ncbi:L-asparaginase [Streptomyces atratus]|uniref:asparaginase n=1 Tax=Streptomyces atratus TaxID=1893 RepID=UPI0019CD7B0C|nr:asparaginase [Streptomyces atratus]GGT67523.1 L-asparaginase [Streptomyces atratus]